jgi:replicative DNA helicase
MRSGLNTNNRESEIAEISRGLKGIAKELNIPVIALSQLSRQVESRTDKKPQLSDLRESGQIEQDADMVMFCYRPEYYGIDNYEVGNTEFETNGLFMLLIEKHRNGELGEVPLKFIHTQAKVTNLFSSNDDSNTESSTFVQQPKSALNGINNEFDFERHEEEGFSF